MGTSTVSGPFRSANGFQQLDENGVWVPVTGGGGGGSPTAILFTPPTDGTTVDVVLPAPAAVGQIYIISSIFVPFITPNGDISINPALLPGQDFPVIQLVISQPSNSVYTYSNDGTYEFTADYLANTFIIIVYTGEIEADGFKFALYNGSQTIRYE